MAVGLAVLLGGVVSAPTSAMADEGGVSFWLPGLFGSLAAAPVQPGWSMTAMEYYDSVPAGGDVALAREVTIGRFNPKLQADINASLHARIDLGLLLPTYTFEQRFLGAQTTLGVLFPVGKVDATLQGTISGTLGPFGFSKFGSRTDEVTAAGDLIPIFQMRWNEGVNNFMTYMTGDLPVGEYDRTSLANIGIGHYALDGGVGYTYLNPQTGHEFSAVAGLSHNYINPYTNYQNGLDFHLDWARRSFSPSSCWSVRWATSTTNSRATAEAATGWARSNLASSASARRSGHLSARSFSRLREPQGLWRVRRPRPAARLQCLALAHDLAAGTADKRVAADDDEVTAAAEPDISSPNVRIGQRLRWRSPEHRPSSRPSTGESSGRVARSSPRKSQSIASVYASLKQTDTTAGRINLGQTGQTA
jgi:hypothetical protein